MARFVTKFSFFLLLVFGSSIAILKTTDIGDNDGYLAVSIDKQRALQAARSPKIIFIGGSNLAFGLDSARVEQVLQMPVVNMGLHGGLGLRYMLDEVKPFVRAGDMIVVIPEYQQFYNRLMDGEGPLIDVLYLYPNARAYLEPPQLNQLLKKFPEYVQKKFQSFVFGVIQRQDSVYYRKAFNAYGDMVAHLSRQSSDVSGEPLFRAKRLDSDADAILVLNEFAAFVRTREARAFFDFPSIPQAHFRANAAIIQDLDRRLTRELQMPILSRPEENALPLNLFYDSVYHLNAQGRTIRTEKIISDVARASIARTR